MRNIRVYLDRPLTAGQTAPLSDFAAAHLTRVLRLTDGAAITCFNGDGHDYRARLALHGRGRGEVQVESRSAVDSESPLEITLAQALARGERMDWVIQKATELGASAIVPLVTERTEVKLDEERAARRMAHWRGVAISACEQCGRARLPRLDPPQVLHAWLASQVGPERDGTARLVLHPDGGRSLGAGVGDRPRVVLAVGPEGGFSDRDLAQFDLASFEPVRLGPRVLRTETAGPAALAVLGALRGDLA
jgi:16S rRNA (uracil1498-N3)-methyltransferase